MHPDKQHFAHGIWYPVVGASAPVLQQEQMYFTENAQTNYERWQLEKYGNFIKARGHEHTERYIRGSQKL